MNHHTKDKGDIGVLKTQVDLAEQGFTVLMPLTEHAPFDLVAYKGSSFRRIQVKYRTLKDGVIEVHFRSTWSDRTGLHVQGVDKSEIDLYCLYCPDTDSCYYLDPSDFGKSCRLRIEKPLNGQTANVNFAEDFKKVP